ncbi:MAG: phosphoribosyltransferase domain-containing protein [Sarcina sp.]
MNIEIKRNIYDINLNDLIVMASRANNEKRNFLFVSKILGKHIEVNPDVCKGIGYILASLICEKNKNTELIVSNFKNHNNNLGKLLNTNYMCKEKVCVLGFAETATGLGMAVASAIKDSFYLTTTRENIISLNSILKFEEEHSHATTHKCYLENLKSLTSSDRIVLVDDEITTGKSMLNIIKELKQVTGIDKYSILSVLDWRNDEYLSLYENFKADNEVEIEVLSLISGIIKNDDETIYYDSDILELKEKVDVKDISGILDRVIYETKENKEESYICNTGRFGISYDDIVNLEKQCEKIAKVINKEIGYKKKVLVLGHGENIYIPSRIAAYLDGEIKFKSTTRSPIYCKNEIGYPVKEKMFFYDRGVKYYFYNKSEIEEKFDEIIFLTETDLNIRLTKNFTIFKI